MKQDHKQPRPNEAGHELISPTAWTVAFGRTFSDIPFSREIFDELEKTARKNNQEIPEGYKEREVAVQFEARYKLTNKLLADSKIKQVLELASGLSPRGLELSRDPEMVLVELDLPDMVRQKGQIIQDILGKKRLTLSGNLFLEAGSALSAESFERCLSHFKKDQPVCVVTEGLLRYLNFEEKEQVAKNVLRSLKKFGGLWLTPDTQALGNRNSEMRRSTDKFSRLTGRNIEKNYFADENHAIAFFESLGFTVETHSLRQVSRQLVSPAKLNLSEQQIEENLTSRRLFAMRPK